MDKASRVFWNTTLFFLIFMGAFAYAQSFPAKAVPLQKSKVPQKNISANPAVKATEKEKTPGRKSGPSQPAEPLEAPKEEGLNFKDPFQTYLPFKKGPKELPQIPETTIAGTDKDKFDYSSLDVTGIVWGTDKPKAIINDEVLGIGDLVEGAEILNISKEGILLKYKDEEYFMKREKEKIEEKNKKTGKFIQSPTQKKKSLQKK